MKNPILYLFTLFLLASCSTEKVDPVGKYETANSNIIEKGYEYLIHNAGVTHGSSLELFQDSTFEFQTCGNFRTGLWSLVNDSIYLRIETDKPTNDSLPSWNYNGDAPIMGFEIDGNILIRKEMDDGILVTTNEGERVPAKITTLIIKLKKKEN